MHTTQIQEPFSGQVDLGSTRRLFVVSSPDPQSSDGAFSGFWCNCSSSYACPEHR